MKRILNIFLFCTIFIAIILVIYSVSIKQEHHLINALEIDILYMGPDIFLKNEDVKKIIMEETGEILTKKITDLNIKEIETHLANNPYISKVNVFISLNGVLKVNVTQRQPIVRISNNKGEFYIDINGDILPLNHSYVSRVTYVNGIIHNYSYEDLKQKNIQFIEGDNDLKNIYHLATVIYKNKFLNALVEQIYVTKYKEFEIVPKIGNHLILLGKADDLENKFQKLELFYKHGITMGGWNNYKLINLKFKNQVVCTKRK